MTKVFTLLAALTLLPTLTACETVKGAGKDLQKAGEAIERAAS